MEFLALKNMHAFYHKIKRGANKVPLCSPSAENKILYGC